MDYMWILAQAEGNQDSSRIGSEPVTSEGQTTTTIQSDPGTEELPPAKPKPNLLLQFAPMILIFVVLYLLMMRGPRKQQQQHKQMVQTLQKNDRVRTIGGILGTVVDIKGDEVTLKIDESNNTKIKVNTSAIGKNLTQASQD